MLFIPHPYKAPFEITRHFVFKVTWKICHVMQGFSIRSVHHINISTSLWMAMIIILKMLKVKISIFSSTILCSLNWALIYEKNFHTLLRCDGPFLSLSSCHLSKKKKDRKNDKCNEVGGVLFLIQVITCHLSHLSIWKHTTLEVH